MKNNMTKLNAWNSMPDLSASELRTVSGGESAPGDVAYWFGRSQVLIAAHFLTGGISTYHLLIKKLTQ